MFSLERALIGFAAAVGDSVSRRPAMHVVGSLVAFGLLAVGILLIEVESDVFKLWVRATCRERYYFFLSSSFEDDDVCSLSSRLVEYHHHHHHHLCVCVSARGSVVRCDSKARRRRTDRARATLFFGRSRSSFFFFADADSNRLWERWRRTENVKQIRWREDERVILTYLPTTNFSLSLSLVCVCCLY